MSYKIVFNKLHLSNILLEHIAFIKHFTLKSLSILQFLLKQIDHTFQTLLESVVFWHQINYIKLQVNSITNKLLHLLKKMADLRISLVNHELKPCTIPHVIPSKVTFQSKQTLQIKISEMLNRGTHIEMRFGLIKR